MSEHICGLIHVHSKYSYDGTLSLKELVRLSKAGGDRFILLTEHAEDFDDDKMSMLVDECRELSDRNFPVISGLEFVCEDMHILAFGIREFIAESSLKKLIKKIHAGGGLAVLAHVVFYDGIPYEKLRELDGVEVWNPRYDGGFSPNPRSLNILKRFRRQNKGIIAFGGLDLHKKEDLGKISLCLRVSELSREAILKALMKGRFIISNGLITFNPKKDPTPHKLFIFYLIRFFYRVKRALEKNLLKKK